MSVEFVKSTETIAAVLTLVTVTFSIPAIEEGVTELLTMAINSSVPKPPFKRSPEFSVCKPEELRPLPFSLDPSKL